METLDLFESVMALKEKTSGTHFAVFDFDGTIIKNDIAQLVMAYGARHDMRRARENFKRYYALLDSGDIQSAYRFGAGTLEGLSIEEVDEIVKKTIIQERDSITTTELLGRTITSGIALRENVLTILGRLRSCGVDTWIVSASPELLVRSAMRFFGLETEVRVIGIRNIVVGGLVTAQLREPLSIFGGKVDCIKQYIHASIRPLVVVGDSMNDYPMLEYAQVQAVVDRGNDLGAIARAKGWFLL